MGYSVITTDGRSHGVPKDIANGDFRAIEGWLDAGGELTEPEPEEE